LAEYQAKLADADRQGREIINARVKEAQSRAMEVQQAAQREIEQMKLRAEAELQRERQEAEDALWEQAGEIILQLGKEVFGKALDEEDNRRLIEQAIDRLRSQPANVETHRQF
jgi:F-type H+-transporting ATPase subunit b